MVQYKVNIIYKKAKKAIRYILKKYYKYKKLWNRQFSKKLLKYVLQDYIINLKLRTSPRFFLIYKLIKTK